jgi:uracil-DNA glycosylase
MSQTNELTQIISDLRQQVLYLRELGVDSLDVSLPERPSKTVVPSESVKTQVRVADPMPEFPANRTAIPEENAPYQSQLGSLPSLASRMVTPSSAVQDKNTAGDGSAQTEIEQAERTSRGSVTVTQDHAPEELFGEIAPSLPEPIETIEQIRAEIGHDCMRCPLHALGRSQVVNSVGNFNAELMFVGEAPGADEDRMGEPFVGRAGQLLTQIIEAIGLKRDDVFIGNINRCRPPGNRAPLEEEAAACKPFLMREIAVVRPKVIVVLGATAAQNLLDTKVTIGKLRGHFHDYMGVKVMPTFHPAYLLRDPNKKRDVWEDMKKVRDFLASLREANQG